jgi:hypothetical protein
MTVKHAAKPISGPAGPHEGERKQQKLGNKTFCIQEVWPTTLYGVIFGANFSQSRPAVRAQTVAVWW